MEAKKRPLSKRKPLADRTNTAATTRRNSSSSAAKPCSSSATRNKPKHSAGNDSPKSHSTNSTCSDGSSPPTDPPASSTSISDSGDTDCRKSGVQTHDSESRQNEGKTVSNTHIIQASNPLNPSTSPSHVGSGSHLYALAQIRSQKPDVQTRNAEGQKDLVIPNVEDSDHETPRTTIMISSVSASGIDDHQKVKLSTVCDQITVPRKRKHAAVEIVLSLSCPHGKKMKKKGIGLDSDGDAKQSGSHTDPLPVHKKNRSRRKHDVSPEEEIERLKAHYADIDAFELPEEEVTSERDLD